MIHHQNINEFIICELRYDMWLHRVHESEYVENKMYNRVSGVIIILKFSNTISSVDMGTNHVDSHYFKTTGCLS